MKNSIITMTAIASLFATSVYAVTDSFEVEVDIENNSGNLTLAEVLGMKFPTIVIDGSTPVGARCHTGGTENALCRNSTPGSENRHHGEYEVSGSFLAPISLTLSDSMSANGLTFTPSFASNSIQTTVNHSLDSNGKRRDYVAGHLKLSNPSAVESRSTVFTYDLTAAYN